MRFKTAVMENILTIFDNLSDAVFVCYLNYGKTLSNFIYVNQTACTHLSYFKVELLNCNPLVVLFNGNETEMINTIDRLSKQQNVFFQTNLMAKSGEAIYVEISASLFNLRTRQAVIFQARDLKIRQHFEEKLTKTTEQLRNLASHLQSIREEERTRIAREIHDELGQVLTVLKIQITLLSKKLNEDQKELKVQIKSVATVLDKTIESVQRISFELRPGILDELGLCAAIEWQAKDFRSRTGINVELDLPKDDLEVGGERATAIFRIFQEALTNIARHANAGKVNVHLFTNENKLILEIKDNGKGITLNQINNPKSLGILGMKERALILGGDVEIKRFMKSGTIVRVEMPVIIE